MNAVEKLKTLKILPKGLIYEKISVAKKGKIVYELELTLKEPYKYPDTDIFHPQHNLQNLLFYFHGSTLKKIKEILDLSVLPYFL